MVEANRSNDNPYPEHIQVWTPCRGWVAGTWAVVMPFSSGVSMEEVVVDTCLVEGQVEAALAAGLDYLDRIASHNMVAGSVLPYALCFPLFGSRCDA
jgi:hypothetical protein